MIIATLALTLASCARILTGKYSAEVDWGILSGEVTYEFKGKNVTMTIVSGLIGFEKSEVLEGTYEITESDEEKGKLVIKFTFGDEITTYSFSEGKIDGEKVIIINSTIFKKSK
jgi:hypothetical protein